MLGLFEHVKFASKAGDALGVKGLFHGYMHATPGIFGFIDHPEATMSEGTDNT